MTSAAAPSTALRVATTSTAVASLAAMIAAHVVPTAVGAAAMLGVVVAALCAARLVSASQAVARRRIAGAALTLASAVAVLASRGQAATNAEHALALLVCVALVSHSSVLDAVRDHRVNLVISSGALLLATGLAPGLGVAVPVFATLVVGVTAVALAARDGGSGETHGSHTEAVADAPSRSGARAVAAVVVMTVLGGLALTLVLPHGDGLGATSRFSSPQETAARTAGTGERSAASYTGDGRLDLDARGTLPDTVVARVTGGDPRLWRAAALEHYDGHGWTADAGHSALLASAPGSDIAVPGDERSPGAQTTAARRDVVALATPGTPVLSPGIATSVRLDTADELVQESDGRLVPGPSVQSYGVESDVVPTVQDVASAASGADATQAVWLELPGSVPQRVLDLARSVTASAPTRAGKVLAVEDYLRTHATYDLSSPVTPAGEDVVDDFLFGSRSGFCEHFATAEVVLLRAVGIPARFVSGFADGVPDGADHRILRASDAHAWVEVWMPGTGWASSDPTAGSKVRSHSGDGIEGTLRAAGRFFAGTTARRMTSAVLLVLLALLGAFLLRRRVRAPRRPVDASARTSALHSAFVRLESALRASGRARAPSESLRALGARLDGTADIRDALHVLEVESYGPSAPGRAETQSAIDQLDRATAQLLADQLGAGAGSRS